MKVLRAFGGWIAGYLISGVTSVLWFTALTHHDAHDAASLRFVAATAVFGIVFAVLGGYVGAWIARDWALGTAATVALLIVAMGAWSWSETPGEPHWTQMVALVGMAPAALAGGWLRMMQRAS